jgi:myo-inositol 2-dehydrogenase/D-chiro-inositol 1-dehydrogenase
MAIHDTAIHEIDVVRWLLDEEIVAASVFKPRRNLRASAHLQDPLVLVLESAGGVFIDVEISVNIAYGYDIRCEIVGDTGTLALGESSHVSVRSENALRTAVPLDWRERFVRAYDSEIQEWINDLAAGRGTTGPNAWDGYAAAVVSDSAVKALHSGGRVTAELREKPDLYRAR